MSQAQINRTKNALRGLFNRDPRPRNMQDIKLSAGEGEDISIAVREMVKDEELMVVQGHDSNFYDVGLKLKPYRLT